MGRRLIIAGNWKMYKTSEESAAFVRQLIPALQVPDREVFLSVPFTLIQGVAAAASEGIKVGAQNMNDCSEGAFTGEIAGRMLLDVGAQFVILGHSERRQLFGEDSSFINRKVKRALEDGLQPVVCIGETLEQREAGQTEEVLREQLSSSLAELTAEQLEKTVLAYEPVWAIGTGKTATSQQAQEVHQMLRAAVSEAWGQEVADGLRILYGGSVKPKNAGELLSQPDIDGVLVGGASLDAESFAAIANAELEALPEVKPSPAAAAGEEEEDGLSSTSYSEPALLTEDEKESFSLDEDALDAGDRVEEVSPEDEVLASFEDEDRVEYEDAAPEELEENNRPSAET